MSSSLRLTRAHRSLGRACGRNSLATGTARLLSTTVIDPVELDYDQLIPNDGNKQDGPLVILHGLFGSKRNWQSLSKAFLKDLRTPIYSLDLRNSGTSPHAEPMTYNAMATDVLHFCRKHSLSNISLLGHSMGGKVAMTFALNPDLPQDMLSNLIVVDVAPSTGDISSEFRGYVEGMKKIDASKVSSRKEAQDILMEYEKDPSIRAFLLTNLSPPTSSTPHVHFRIPMSILGNAISEIGRFPYESDDRTWDGHTLFIKGDKSRYINPRNIPLARKHFPNMVLETLDTGHWVHAEKPNEFRNLVTDFIRIS